MRRIVGILTLLLTVVPACGGEDNTKIVAAVWSDLAIPAELDTVRIDVSGPRGKTSDSFSLTAASEPGKSRLPVELELVPLGANDATFTVSAVGLHAQAEVVSQSARVSFVSGQALLLKLFLGRACENVRCPDDYTCSGGACNQPIAVPLLPPYDPSKPLQSPDAGAVVDSRAGDDSGFGLDGAIDGLAIDVLARQDSEAAADEHPADDRFPDVTDAPIIVGADALDAAPSDNGSSEVADVPTTVGGDALDVLAADSASIDAADAPVGGGGFGGAGAAGSGGGSAGTGGAAGAAGPTANLVASGSSLPSYGLVVVGQTSTEASFTVTNTGQQTSGVLSVQSSSTEFVIRGGSPGDCSPDVTLAGNASCTVRVVFTPASEGSRSALITFSGTPGGSGSVGVSGTGETAALLTAGSTTSLSFGVVQIGLSSVVQSLALRNNGQAASGVITLNSSNSDFAIQSGLTGECVSGSTTLAGGASCTVNLVFTPSSSGNRSGTITFSASPGGSGSVGLSGVGKTGTLAVVAGTPSGIGSADGTGSAARFYYPTGIAVDGAGNLFVADYSSNTIRKVTPAGVVTTIAGMVGSSGSADGTGVAARFDSPRGVAVDGAGNLFIADWGNNTIRKMTSGGAVSTLAGTAGLSGSADGTGAAARFNHPARLAVDGAGNLFVTDWGNNTIRKITPTGVVTTFAGSAGSSGSADGIGTAASFSSPGGVAADSSGNLLVTDSANIGSIRKITSAGVVTTLASGVGYGIEGLAVDGAGNVFVADGESTTIKKVTPAGVVTTFAGNPTAGWGGSADGTGTAAGFYGPTGVAIDTAGNLFVADSGNNAIRKITPAAVVTTFVGVAGSYGSADSTGTSATFSQPRGVVVDGSGNVFVVSVNRPPFGPTIRKVTPAGAVTTLAGTPNFTGSTDGTGAAAAFYGPTGVAANAVGNLFVADSDNHTIRKITPAGVVTTFAGTAGLSGSTDGVGAAARFNSPRGVAVDGSGNLFVTDSRNHTIRSITPGGVVATLAGAAGLSGSADGAGGAARFNSPKGVALDGSSNLVVVDGGNNTIRKVTRAGVVTTLAGTAGASGNADGTGAAARFSSPEGVAVDQSGSVLVADYRNNAIRKITPAGVVSTIVGSSSPTTVGNFPGPLPASLANPVGVAVDSSTGNIYITINDALMVVTW